ncbi:hypothetical protein BOW52_10330 [Solemya elarraichensis gill symbiont]|uniref:Uncharacterized protein n=1 Tax=Solemya elarraichensis gill symbiont TaxID=1918949 RepID=A0A1T2KWF8_9GAMM|nr:hypothetical protein BOW52_10330 [Solemya elarraichensis gill symbiont]
MNEIVFRNMAKKRLYKLIIILIVSLLIMFFAFEMKQWVSDSYVWQGTVINIIFTSLTVIGFAVFLFSLMYIYLW